jgi:transcriptional regulator with XRE-family HTH domain
MKRVNRPDQQFAAIVLRVRKERGITQEDLAYEANLTISAMARIERGESNPAWTSVLSVIAALGITLRDLAGAVEGEQTHPSLAHEGGE